ncbi:exosome nuclease subunit [Coemansia sp. Benny D115]|nr:exosome nuclease subunit [Coemansia sp. Benny D115]
MDFAADFDARVKQAFGALVGATKAAARLPADLSFHRTLDEDVDQRLEATGAQTLKLANILWRKAHADPTVPAVESVDDLALQAAQGGWQAAPGFRPVVEAVDTLLEKIDVGLDEVLRRPAHRLRAQAGAAQAAPRLTSVASSNDKQTQAPVRLVTSANVPRPQLLFADTVDNSATTPFVWKIREKLHALVPLDHGLPGAQVTGTALGHHLASLGIGGSPSNSGASTPRRADAGTDAGQPLSDLPHPYAYEIRHQPAPPQLFEDSAARKPNDWDATPFEYVDTEEALERMVEHLEAQPEVAIDLEHHSYRSYLGFTCVVQLSSRERDYVVDALALRASLHKLNRITTDPRVVKVLHGAESDIVWLQRDFGVYVVGLFDTYHASHVLNMAHHSLAFLLKEYCQFVADKKYQLADWRIRPLPQEMMHYARADTHFLLYVYDCMRNELLSRGRELVGQDVGTPGQPGFGLLAGLGTVTSALQPMELVLQRSATTALNRFVKDAYDADHGLGPGGWAALLRKWRSPFSPVQLAVFRALHRWRDTCARQEDESTGYVLPNHMLFSVSDRMPRDAAALMAACQPTPPLVRLNAQDIVQIIKQAREGAERRMQEFSAMVADARGHAEGSTSAIAEDAPRAPVHTRFEQLDLTDATDTPVAEVLTDEVRRQAAALTSPVSELFGSQLTSTPTLPSSEAMRRAQDIRANLVLAVAVPKQVISGAQLAEQTFTKVTKNASKRQHDESSKDEEPTVKNNAAVVISETYAKYVPENHQASASHQPAHKKQKTEEEMPTIALGTDSSDDDSDDGRANQKSLRAKTRGKRAAGNKAAVKVSASDVVPHSYDQDSQDDVIGPSAEPVNKKTKKKNRQKKAQASFNPYGQMTTTKEL